MAENTYTNKAQKDAKAQAQAQNTNSSGKINQINREFQEKATLKQAKELNLPYINIAKTPLNPDFLKIISFKDATKAKLIPFFKVGNKVRVAVSDVDNPETKAVIEKIKSQGLIVSLNLASEAGIADALKFYESTQLYIKKKIIKKVQKESIETYEKEISKLASLPAEIGKVTAEEGLNLLNVGAMKTQASDVHFEPQGGTVLVRFRIDGVLHKVFELKPNVYEKIAEQIKFQSKMKLNVTTVPQDGRYVFTFNNNKTAVRVASIPTPHGESYVCRFLTSEKKFKTFEELGFQGNSLEKLQKSAKISQGMVLITGPTGSGKSTTLYSLLAAMNTSENKIITLEDPVEYYMDNIIQSQIDEKKDYTFANGLRSLLRHDPDIVMIGEIRDLKTAEVAAQASLTGHVMLSTLHTNSALECIPRLINMGLAPFMVAPSLNTIIAQRLVRKVCGACSKMENISESERKEFEGAGVDIPEKVPHTVGCDKCSNTGYSGRLVIAEAVVITTEMKNLILNNASLGDYVTAARKDGMITIKEDGLSKVAQGLTTISEVLRVFNFVK